MCEPLCKSCSHLAAQIALYKVGPEFRLPKTVRDDEWKNHPNNGSTGAVKNLRGDKRGHYPLPRRVHGWRNQRIPRRYRQLIASDNKAASDSSFHCGSRRGGYGYGLAVVSCASRARLGFSVSPQAKSSGSGSTRTRRSLGLGARISIESLRMSRRSTARKNR